jgi:hypothetical protein
MSNVEKAKAYLDLAVKTFLEGDCATSYELFIEGMTSYTTAAEEKASDLQSVPDIIAASLAESIQEVSSTEPILNLNDRLQSLIGG